MIRFLHIKQEGEYRWKKTFTIRKNQSAPLAGRNTHTLRRTLSRTPKCLHTSAARASGKRKIHSLSRYHYTAKLTKILSNFVKLNESLFYILTRYYYPDKLTFVTNPCCDYKELVHMTKDEREQLIESLREEISSLTDEEFLELMMIL